MEITVIDSPVHMRFAAHAPNGDQVGDVTYVRTGDVWNLVGTHVSPAHGGQGIGTSLVRQVLSNISAKGGQVIATCPFVAAYVERHPEEATLAEETDAAAR